jgi:hydroxymethylpyrimidine pyrophosphatase-like HAD family hydrolase
LGNITCAVDFDGTVLTNDFPLIGKEVPDAIRVLKLLQNAGVKIILLTMRSGSTLDDAVKYMIKSGIELYDINNNKSQISWSRSKKVYRTFYIGDDAIGCPLINNNFHEKSYVDWKKIEILLRELKYLPIVDIELDF